MHWQIVLLLGAVATAWGMDNEVPPKADKVSHKMWRIKTNGEVSGLSNQRRVHFDASHHLGSMSSSARPVSMSPLMVESSSSIPENLRSSRMNPRSRRRIVSP